MFAGDHDQIAVDNDVGEAGGQADQAFAAFLINAMSSSDAKTSR